MRSDQRKAMFAKLNREKRQLAVDKRYYDKLQKVEHHNQELKKAIHEIKTKDFQYRHPHLVSSLNKAKETARKTGIAINEYEKRHAPGQKAAVKKGLLKLKRYLSK